jgi:hypothetical protein
MARFNSRQGAMMGIFSLRHHIQAGSGAHPAFFPMGTGGFVPGLKRPGCEADQLPPSSAEVKNVSSYNSTLQYVFMAWRSVKYRDMFTSTIPLTQFTVPYVNRVAQSVQ